MIRGGDLCSGVLSNQTDCMTNPSLKMIRLTDDTMTDFSAASNIIIAILWTRACDD